MGLSFRKSVRLGGGVRLNLSSSGVGVSAGVKGFRVSTGPRGSYVTVGGHGLYWREKIGGPYGQPNAPRPRPEPSDDSIRYVPIPDVSALTGESSAALLGQLNAVTHTPALWPWAFLLGVFATPVVFFVVGMMLDDGGPLTLFLPFAAALLVMALTIGLCVALSRRDARRRVFSMSYELDAEDAARWDALRAALDRLATSERLWRVLSLHDNENWKYNGGAGVVSDRRRVSLTRQPMPNVSTDVEPVCLDLGTGQPTLFFLPDRLYVYQSGNFGAVEYSNIGVDSGQLTFSEEGTPASDTYVVGSTWEHLNKDGSPDLRFKYNPSLSVCVYGAVLLQSHEGLTLLLHTSSPEVAAAFAGMMHNFDALLNATHTEGDVPGADGRAADAPTAPSALPSGGAHPAELGDYTPCARCGYLLTPLDETCPRCHAAQPVRGQPSLPTDTQRGPDADP